MAKKLFVHEQVHDAAYGGWLKEPVGSAYLMDEAAGGKGIEKQISYIFETVSNLIDMLTAKGIVTGDEALEIMDFHRYSGWRLALEKDGGEA